MATGRIRGDPLLIEPIQKIQEVESPVPLCERLQGKIDRKVLVYLEPQVSKPPSDVQAVCL